MSDEHYSDAESEMVSVTIANEDNNTVFTSNGKLAATPEEEDEELFYKTPKAAIQASSSVVDVKDDGESGGCVALRFVDVTKSFETMDGELKTVLHGVSGSVNPGEMMALMGPSGGGKTSLLDCFHPERGGQRRGGKVLLNGYKLKKAMKRKISYVLQDDIFFLSLSVRESLTYTARLRLALPTERAKIEKVSEVITLMGLDKCADTPIMLLSGGERKRTNIATELLTSPALLLLDEPTSGLDATTAAGVIASLRKLADTGKTVVSSIHQPSSKIFLSFDRVLLLADGHTVYYGRPSGCVEYFHEQGFDLPSNYNPADFIMDTINTPGSEGVENKQRMIEAWASKEEVKKERTVEEFQGTTSARRLAKLSSRVVSSPGMLARFSSLVGRDSRVMSDEGRDDDDGPVDDSDDEEGDDEGEKGLARFEDMGPKWPTSWTYQFIVLSQRSFRLARAEVLSVLNFIQCFFLSVIVGLLWLRMDTDESGTPDRVSYVFFSMIFWPFNALFRALLTFPTAAHVVAKEREAGSYRLSAYFMAQTLAELPIQFVFPLIYMCISFWMSGVSNDAGVFFGMTGLLLLVTVASQSIGLCIGTNILIYPRAMVVATLWMLTSMLLGGFWIQELPTWLAWAEWISFIRYSYNAMVGLVFRDPVKCDGSGTLNACNNSADGYASSDEVLNDLGIKLSVGVNASFLIAYTIVVRIPAYLALRFKPRHGPRR